MPVIHGLSAAEKEMLRDPVDMEEMAGEAAARALRVAHTHPHGACMTLCISAELDGACMRSGRAPHTLLATAASCARVRLYARLRGCVSASCARVCVRVRAPCMRAGRGQGLAGARVSVVYANIVRLYISRIAEGGLGASVPAMLLRPLAAIDDVMGAYGQCVKLAFTQFPFPWAQVVYMFLFLLAVTLPFIVVQFVREPWMAVMANFLVVTAFWSINEVAQELEDPFG